MTIKEATVGELGLKPAFVDRLDDHCFYENIISRGEDIRSLPVSKLTHSLNHEELGKWRGVGLTSIAQLRVKLKELGYDHKTCPFLFQKTKSEAKEKLKNQLQHRKLSATEFELVWDIACETRNTCGIISWVEFLYDE